MNKLAFASNVLNEMAKEATLGGLATAATLGAAGVAGVSHGMKARGYMAGFKPATHAAMGYTGEGMNINSLIKQAAEQDPEKYQFILNAAQELQDSPFLEETIERQNATIEAAKEKIASSIWTRNSFGGHMARGAAAVLGTTAAGIGYEVLSDLYGDAKGAVTKDRNYKKMLEKNPDLEEFDQDKVKSVFNTLHTFAGPKFSADPNIAGTFVRNQVALHQGMPQGVDMGAINQLISARGTHERSGKLEHPVSIPGMDIHNHQLNIAKNDYEGERRTVEKSRLELEQKKHKYERDRDEQRGQSEAKENELRKQMTEWKHKMESDRYAAWESWTKAVDEANRTGGTPPPKPAILGGGPNGGRKGGKRP